MLCENFKYPVLLEHFEKISSIPRASYHEEKIAAYLVDFAKARGLEYYTDDTNNVLINLPASAGCENREPILLQGHTDMVCEKNIGCEHDFDNDGLDLFVEGGYIGARGTTLGADDGIAVAVMLAVLDGAIERHPAVQCLFTASEEVGLDGAKAFDYSRIFARRMINMDGADEIYLVVGCAGGVRSDCSFDIKFADAKNAKVFELTIGGLMGGHSGENINDGRANANKLAGRLLALLCDRAGAEVVSIDGGSKENAIPREAVMKIVANDAGLVKTIADDFVADVKIGLCREDEGFNIAVKECDEAVERVFAPEFTRDILAFINGIDNGVLKMSDKIEVLVEYSRNLGIIVTEGDTLGIYLSSRSAIDAQLDESMETIESLAVKSRGATKHHNRYPGWNVMGESKLADSFIESAKTLCGVNIIKTALHAGLECGIVKQAIPDIEIVSCGPDIHDLHSPKERLGIASFERFFTVIKDIIENK